MPAFHGFLTGYLSIPLLMPTVLITSKFKIKMVSYFATKLSLFWNSRELQFWTCKVTKPQAISGTEGRKALLQRRAGAGVAMETQRSWQKRSWKPRGSSLAGQWWEGEAGCLLLGR